MQVITNKGPINFIKLGENVSYTIAYRHTFLDRNLFLRSDLYEIIEKDKIISSITANTLANTIYKIISKLNKFKTISIFAMIIIVIFMIIDFTTNNLFINSLIDLIFSSLIFIGIIFIGFIMYIRHMIKCYNETIFNNLNHELKSNYDKKTIELLIGRLEKLLPRGTGFDKIYTILDHYIK